MGFCPRPQEKDQGPKGKDLMFRSLWIFDIQAKLRQHLPDMCTHHSHVPSFVKIYGWEVLELTITGQARYSLPRCMDTVPG